ncbi:MAG: cytosine deaminase, partial [Anaerolineales bacterium]|nr:cytosine deaminase [Anaerolineales bacterium]
MKMYDILIRNAQFRHTPDSSQDGKMTVAVADGKIAAIAGKVGGKANVEIDAKGMLVTESFVNPHLHLCKVYTLQMMDEKALRDYHA